MKLSQSHNNNILLNKISNSSLLEYIPPLISKGVNILSFDTNVIWSNLLGSNYISVNYDTSSNIIIDCSINLNDLLQGTEMYFSEGRIGLGRKPLHSYKFDISVSENTRTTALHIGDGIHGFSLGNATNSGFLPQIIGVGSDGNDAGLYFLGKTVMDSTSGIPVIVLDGRNLDDSPLFNRPILGITSGKYNEYIFIVNADGKVGVNKIPTDYEMEINGEILVHDIIIETLNKNISLIDEINDLKRRISLLE